jgi:hypothetical protein
LTGGPSSPRRSTRSPAASKTPSAQRSGSRPGGGHGGIVGHFAARQAERRGRRHPSLTSFLGHLSTWARPVRSWVRGGKCPPITRRTTMTQCLLSVHSVDGEVGDPTTDEEMQQCYREVDVFNEEMKSAGAWVFAGRCTNPTPPPSCACPTARSDHRPPLRGAEGTARRLRHHRVRGPRRCARLGVEGHRCGHEADRGPSVLGGTRRLTVCATATPQPTPTRPKSAGSPRLPPRECHLGSIRTRRR